MTRSLLLVSALMAFAAFSPALAQDKPAKEEPKPAEKTESVLKKAPPKAEENTPLHKWRDAENALIDPLSPKDQESFLVLRQKYSIIKAIGIAKGDIGNAVKACGKANPDMKDKMEGRFGQWKNAVDPIIETATKTFDKDLDNQKIVDPKEARKVLKLQDAAYEYSEKQTTKMPVSSKEACEDLVKSMDRTEDEMIKLLRTTLLPESALRQEYEQGQKAKAKAAKESSKEKPKAN